MSKFKVGMAVMAVVMALSVSAVAFAQGPNPPAQSTPTPAQTFWQTLASKLNVTVEVLQQDVRDALKAVVAQLLKDGKLTQTQADSANARIDKQLFDKGMFGPFSGGRGFGMERGGMGRGGFAGGNAEMDAAAAKLGMTTQELMAELRAGKSLADVAKVKNVSADDLKAAIIAGVNAQIDQAVKDGKLTQTQADQLKSKLDSQIDLNRSFPNGGRFKGHGFGWQGRATPQPGTPQ